MRNRTQGLAVLTLVAFLPLAACDAGDTEELGDEGLEEIETAPATETIPADGAVGAMEMSGWDRDANQQLSREEWDAWYGDEDVYGTWNADGEEGLTQEEYGQGAYDFWDADANDELTEQEWDEGVETWYGDEDYGTWGEWDANGDSVLDANEVAEGMERENLYDTVDRDSDALIDDEELADWWFDLWDGNDDELIDTTEWDEVGAEWSRIGSGAMGM